MPDQPHADPPAAPHLNRVIQARVTRRDFLLVAGAAVGSLALRHPLGLGEASAQAPPQADAFLTFTEIADPTPTLTHRVAPGYQAEVLLRWGDPIHADAPAFDPMAQTADSQNRQAGYNCDFIAYMPLPRGSDTSDHGLLCVNHEYVTPKAMWPPEIAAQLTPERVATEIAAHGHSIVEIRLVDGHWQIVADSVFNRRLTAATPMHISGPAAGHELLKTSADPTGTRVLGTLNNCAGGTTPWGTVLIAEENFYAYFMGDAPTQLHKTYGLGVTVHRWGEVERRFHLDHEPNEPNRFGWIVEYDPYDPSSTPVKRSALGRFRHEGATTHINVDGRIIVYSGDDEPSQHIYRFVSRDRYSPETPQPDLLDHGTLSVAQLTADGKLHWRPLVHGQGPLTAANGFHSQADVLIDTRRAARLLGATPMDRPEDIETNPRNGYTYVMLTNNKGRKETDPGSPRAPNNDGHILELIPPGGGDHRPPDHAADVFDWQLFLVAGPEGSDGIQYAPGTTTAGHLASPDNVAFDPMTGHMWIATDMASRTQQQYGMSDGVWATAVSGPNRGITRMFFACPIGAELCGPCFTPDGRTLFVSVQHPGEGGTFAAPTTRWPDFDPDTPPRPSVVAIRHPDGRLIGR